MENTKNSKNEETSYQDSEARLGDINNTIKNTEKNLKNLEKQKRELEAKVKFFPCPEKKKEAEDKINVYLKQESGKEISLYNLTDKDCKNFKSYKSGYSIRGEIEQNLLYLINYYLSTKNLKMAKKTKEITDILDENACYKGVYKSLKKALEEKIKTLEKKQNSRSFFNEAI